MISENRERNQHFAHKVFSFLHWLCTFPIIIDIFLIVAFLDLLLKGKLAIMFLWFYAFCISFVWIAKLTYFIATEKLDKNEEAI